MERTIPHLPPGDNWRLRDFQEQRVKLEPNRLQDSGNQMGRLMNQYIGFFWGIFITADNSTPEQNEAGN